MNISEQSIAEPGHDSFFIFSQPGAETYDGSLIKQFEEMKSKRGPSYVPRTKHLRGDGWAKYTNRLFLESSPYLLQHAHNPVNWYPWGDEAFDAAKKMNRPVFLSVGYSTCHWCHVMEEESFEDEEIARYLNKHFIAVKVDREERPDIDSIYMSAVQALTGRGGWPMSVWLSPVRKPFYGGTYFPARDGDRGTNIGFLTLLEKLNEVFHQTDGKVAYAAQQVTDAVKKMLSSPPGQQLPKRDVLETAVKIYRQSYDRKYGGLSGAPKFPSSLPIRLLLRYHRQTGDRDVLDMATQSLLKMAGGGMYDHVGGGFHRYSTDEQWLVPHFEKMLYDNALLVGVYLEAYQVTKDDYFKQVVNDVLKYVRREMTSPGGAFYSATDADSMTPGGHMEEGWYFTWLPEEMEHVLGKERARAMQVYYSVTGRPNFEGRYILHTPETVSATAARLNIPEKELFAVIRESNEALYQQRKQRPAPLRDEKILTSWNGLMISAFAKAGMVLDNPDYIDQAKNAALFILDHMYQNNRLFRSYKDQTARHNAYLDDYAFFIASLIDLYEASHQIIWLEKAMELDDVISAFYEDKEAGGFFMTSTDHEELITREKPYYDNAIPSGNAIAVLNLLRFYSLTADYRFKQRAENALKAFSGRMIANPAAMAEMLVAVDYYLDNAMEIILVVPDGKEKEKKAMLAQLNNRFVPNRVLVVSGESGVTSNAGLIPPVSGKRAINGKVTAYVCENGACGLPASTPEEFARQL